MLAPHAFPTCSRHLIHRIFLPTLVILRKTPCHIDGQLPQRRHPSRLFHRYLSHILGQRNLRHARLVCKLLPKTIARSLTIIIITTTTTTTSCALSQGDISHTGSQTPSLAHSTTSTSPDCAQVCVPYPTPQCLPSIPRMSFYHVQLYPYIYYQPLFNQEGMH